jgi:hypothetical protein
MLPVARHTHTGKGTVVRVGVSEANKHATVATLIGEECIDMLHESQHELLFNLVFSGGANGPSRMSAKVARRVSAVIASTHSFTQHSQ